MFGIIHRLMREKSALSAKRCDLAGSPPPMRGKGSVPCFPALLYGITPAYAGKSWARTRAFPSCWDHPRLCGEKSAGIAYSCRAVGSPPPMRGKGVVVPAQIHDVGITPAYVGKSTAAVRPPRRRRDHPRLCGEKRRCLGAFQSLLGITPAYAGKSSPRSKGA